MRLSIVLHVLIAGVFAASTAMACRLLFLMPIWAGGMLGLILYAIVLAGNWLGDRFE